MDIYFLSDSIYLFIHYDEFIFTEDGITFFETFLSVSKLKEKKYNYKDFGRR